MSERKVLNKYFPPDFDPAKIGRRKLGKERQQVVRLMAPFSMRCNTCGEYIYKGKKFNARKETVHGETYYGIKIFRFYIKCTRCSAEITFKTDPKNTDYAAEHGAQRNFEPWRDEEATEEDKLALLEAEELAQEAKDRPNAAGLDNPMAALEERTVESKREMDILDKLMEIKSRNSRREKVGKGDIDATIDSLNKGGLIAREGEEVIKDLQKQIEEDEIEQEVRRVFYKVQAEGEGASTSSNVEPLQEGTEDASTSKLTTSLSVKRKLQEVEPQAEELLNEDTKKLVQGFSFSSTSSFAGAKKRKKAELAKKFGIVKK